MKLKPYAFTSQIIKGKKAATPSSYETFFTNVTNRGAKFSYAYFERGSKGNCHCHGVVLLPETDGGKIGIECRTVGFSSKYVKLYDAGGWLSYCGKYSGRNEWPIQTEFNTGATNLDTNSEAEWSFDDLIDVPTPIPKKRLV